MRNLKLDFCSKQYTKKPKHLTNMTYNIEKYNRPVTYLSTGIICQFKHVKCMNIKYVEMFETSKPKVLGLL